MKPETVGMSSVRLARLDEVMRRRYVDGGYLPGMLTLIYRKGHLIHTGICGRMDIERDKRMREDAIFRIYSMSKPITAVALMMLVEQGLERDRPTGLRRPDRRPAVHDSSVRCGAAR
jgi:CubicO group peptidase (beta-lactamase class C family)